MAEWFKNLFDQIVNFFTQREEVEFTVLEKMLISIALILVAWLVIKIIETILKKIFRVKKSLEEERGARVFVIKVIKFILWIAVAFILFGILEINVDTFAGVLSAVTVALGLALQDVIGAFASGLIIINQKFIKIGDYIQVANSYSTVEGTVKKIGICVTTLKNYDGQTITVSNSNIIKSNVINYTHERLRRVVCTLGIRYSDNIDLAKKIMKKCALKDKRVSNEFEPDVHVTKFGDFAIDVTCKVWTDIDDYWNVNFELPEEIYKEFLKNGIDIPSSTTLNVVTEKKTK